MSAELHAHVRQAAEDFLARLEQIRQAAGRDANWHSREREQLNSTEETHVFDALQHCLNELQATGIVGPENQLLSQTLWKVAGQQLAHGSLQLHARMKPRGYAGDDLLLARIFDESVGDHPLGRVFDRFFQAQDACRAVRGRIRQAAKLCAETLESFCFDADHVIEQKVAVIGAGPAIEIELATRAMLEMESYHADWMSVVLFDLDEAALTAAQTRLLELPNNAPIKIVRENLFRLARQPRRAKDLGQSTFIVCLGLLDYLDDEDAAALLALCWRNLIYHGQMLVGNFAPHCQARAYMEWIGNWYLTYRTEAELRNLAHRAGIPAEQADIETEPNGVNLLLRARKS